MLPPGYSIKNHLLAAMDKPALRQLLPSLCEVPLTVEQVLEVPGERIAEVFFIESGLVSVFATSPRDRRCAIAMIGHEGMTGVAAILGDHQWANETIVQSAGSALAISTEDLGNAMLANPSLRRCLLRFVHAFLSQTSQTTLASSCAKLEERLARWILMSQDRLGGANLGVTHGMLAQLLAVRRPGVTLALHFLESKGLIKTTRSRIMVLDRDGLRSKADGSYGIPEAEYARLFGP
jgi:CRP-like cAMP-binding protein